MNRSRRDRVRLGRPSKAARTAPACCAALGLLAACGAPSSSRSGTLDLDASALRQLLAVPESLELPAFPASNPPTQAKIDLGRQLFYDRRLSANGTKACGSCHFQRLAFADGKRTPVGSTGQVLHRNSPALQNAAYYSTLTWANDALTSFERQLPVPIRGDDPVELGVSDGRRDEVLSRFDSDPATRALFADAFPESETGATIDKIVFALATFCRTLVSADSAYDRYAQGDKTALTEQQRRGLSLFNGERFECFHCHSGTNLTVSYQDAGTDPDRVRIAFFNDGLYNVDGTGSYPAYDQGLYDLTLDPRDRGRFRPPSLRNVAVTAPYMHDGSVATLRDVVRQYAAGGRVLETSDYAGDGRTSPLKSGLIRGFQATDEEIDAVVAFLESLTDVSFLENPRFSNPSGSGDLED